MPDRLERLAGDAARLAADRREARTAFERRLVEQLRFLFQQHERLVAARISVRPNEVLTQARSFDSALADVAESIADSAFPRVPGEPS